MLTALTANDKKILRRIREKVISTHWIKFDYYRVQTSGKAKGKEKCCLVGMVNVETLPPEIWSQGDPGSYGSGTIYQAAGKKVPPPVVKRRDRILHALRDAATEHEHRDIHNIESFNDAKGTKRQDVIDVIDIALGDK